jgi:ParB/RepB/Spo0J family partition protein
VPDSDTTPTDPSNSTSVFRDEDRLLDDASVTDVTQSSRPTREGLPPTYRMRATAHYVDSLASGPPSGREQEQMLDPREIECNEPSNAVSLTPVTESIKAYGVVQPLLVRGRNGEYQLMDGAARLQASIAAGVRKVPCIVYDVDSERAQVLAEAARVQATALNTTTATRTILNHLTDEGSVAIARSLKTLALCADMVTSGASSLSKTVAADLIKAEVWRALCLLQAVRAIQGVLPVRHVPVSVRRMIDRITRELIPEQRLRGFEIEPQMEIPEGSVVMGDEDQLVAAVSGAILATLALVEGTTGSRFTLKASAVPAGQVTIDLVQATARAPEEWLARAFDATWAERPGGALATLAMLSVRAIVEQHQGRVTTAASGRGTRIAIAIPAGLPARR